MKIRLSLMIPALLIISALICSSLVFLQQSREARQEIQHDGVNEINTILTYLQNVLNTQLTNDNYEDAKVSISVSTLKAGVRIILLVDAEDTILLANRYSLIGEKARLFSGYDPSIAGEVRRTLAAHISMAADKQILHGYCPVILKLGTTGISRIVLACCLSNMT